MPPNSPGPAGRAPRPARGAGARGARARRSRGRDLPPRRGADASEDGTVVPRLAALVRKELIRPDRTQLPGDDAFRFRHLLVRDAAYDGLSKAIRAELHERFADWLDERGADLVEVDEILGFHLEQAARYKAELGETDRELAERAGERLAAAGRRALARGDQRGGSPAPRARVSSSRGRGLSTCTSRSTWRMRRCRLATRRSGCRGRRRASAAAGRSAWRGARGGRRR